MSTLDTLTPLLSTPWLDAHGNPLSVRALPGATPELLAARQRSKALIATPALNELLKQCGGLADTELGHIDFSGSWFPPEPCPIFRPCLTLAVDDAGRRWIAEAKTNGDSDSNYEARRSPLPGPIWCVFPDPQVAVYVSEDLSAFIASLRECAAKGETLSWLQSLQVQAVTVWALRHSLAHRPYQLDESDEQVRDWLAGLPATAYVYDLRKPSAARGWPYGVAGARGQLYRCGRLPLFAVVGSPFEGWCRAFRATAPGSSPAAKARAQPIEFVEARRNRREWRIPSVTPQTEPLELRPYA